MAPKNQPTPQQRDVLKAAEGWYDAYNNGDEDDKFDAERRLAEAMHYLRLAKKKR